MVVLPWLLTMLLLSSPIDAADKPNFLFVIIDDLRPALGCYGDPKAHTPNLDRLAQKYSVVFDKAYAQQALCAPSRNSLLTSRRPDTLGLYDFYSYWRDVAGNFTTLPQHLKNHGYATASIGKVFHPGVSSNYSDDSPYSWTETPFHPYTQRYKDAPVCSSRDSVNSSNLICPVRVASMPNATLPDIEILQAAEKFLTIQRKEPFFLAVGFHKPHVPLKYPKKYLKYHPLKKFSLPDNYVWPNNVSSVAYNPFTDIRQRDDVKKLEVPCPWGKIPKRFAKKIIQSYYAAVTYIDDLIGKLLQQLDKLQVRNNTVIIVTSDHGWSLGEHTEWSKYSNFEVSLRVPMILSIPNVTFTRANYNKQSLAMSEKSIEFHKKCSKVILDPVELLDLFPTVAEIAGFPIPKCLGKKLNGVVSELCTDGSSLLGLLKTRCKASAWKRVSISQYPRPSIKPACKSSSDKPRLKYINIMGYTVRTFTYRYTAWVGFSNTSKQPDWQDILAEELYDHSIDSEENKNLANLKNYNIVKKELRNILINNY